MNYSEEPFTHLGMEEVLPLLWILWVLPLDIGGGNNGTGIRINDLLPFVIAFVWF